MKEGIYPSGVIRSNYMACMYCEMAMEAYYDASQHYAEIIRMAYSYDAKDELDAMNKCVVMTTVFSAMSIEAFINDYAATCLGDSDFYDNFDRLSTMSKFELIARFILHSAINKDKACYSYLKALFKQRDSYVHSKSHAVKNMGMSKAEWEEYHAHFSPDEPEEAPPLEKREIDRGMRDARDALKAIKEFAIYFDNRDSGAYALHKLFGPSSVIYGSERERRYKQYVFSLLGIKVSG